MQSFIWLKQRCESYSHYMKQINCTVSDEYSDKKQQIQLRVFKMVHAHPIFWQMVCTGFRQAGINQQGNWTMGLSDGPTWYVQVTDCYWRSGISPSETEWNVVGQTMWSIHFLQQSICSSCRSKLMELELLI